MNGSKIVYLDSFRVKNILKEIKKFIGKKNIMTTFYRIQACNSITCGYICIVFIYFMLKGKSLV